MTFNLSTDPEVREQSNRHSWGWKIEAPIIDGFAIINDIYGCDETGECRPNTLVTVVNPKPISN